MTDGYVPFFTHHVPEWRWKDVSEYRHRAMNDMNTSVVALVEMLAGR